MRPNRSTPLIFACLAVLLLAGCNFPGYRPTRSEGDRDAPFIPPTLVVLPTAAPTQTLAPAEPTQVVDCQDNLRFVEDLTIPDGTVVQTGVAIDKQWRVQNTGTCNWTEGYRVKLIEGQEMGAAPDQALFPARSGAEAVLSIQFSAPSEPGTYTSAWQAHDPAGAPFGDPFYIQIVVQ